jgi:RHS repeat-associated protein
LIENQKYSVSENKYLYNGKELQDDNLAGSSLNWFDYGHRFYDPQIARFTTRDFDIEKYRRCTPYGYAIDNPIRFEDYNGDGPKDRVQAAKKMVGTEYKQEDNSQNLRTANTPEALKYMDCAEFVCRDLAADDITNGVKHMAGSSLQAFFDDEETFIHSQTPQVGDYAVWDGHYGVVTAVGENGTIKLTHARGSGRLAKENKDAIDPEDYRPGSDFYGYYRPVHETPDGKLDKNQNSETEKKEGEKKDDRSKNNNTMSWTQALTLISSWLLRNPNIITN